MVASCKVASCMVTSCKVASCKVASCKVASCTGIDITYRQRDKKLIKSNYLC
jgi:hypothetical protein